MFGIKKCKDCGLSDQNSNSDFEKFELELKIYKTKIHAKYISCIAMGIVVWIIATGQANTPEFSQWISFASTITSIILSVVAIFMSISGENKNILMQNKLEITAKRIDDMIQELENANDISKGNIMEMKEEIENLRMTIAKIPDETVTKMVKSYKIESNENMGWVSRNEEE